MTVYSRQLGQLLQLPPPQLAQLPPPPAIGAVVPNASEERHAKFDKALMAWCLHLGHCAVSLDWLMGRINSNLVLHSGQVYS